jgi:hypothetical protein
MLEPERFEVKERLRLRLRLRVRLRLRKFEVRRRLRDESGESRKPSTVNSQL